MTPRAPWLRSFTPRDSTFFAQEIRADLQQVADILDESKAHVLPLEPIEPKPQSRIVERICWTASGALLGWLGWAVLNAPAP